MAFRKFTFFSFFLTITVIATVVGGCASSNSSSSGNGKEVAASGRAEAEELLELVESTNIEFAKGQVEQLLSGLQSGSVERVLSGSDIDLGSEAYENMMFDEDLIISSRQRSLRYRAPEGPVCGCEVLDVKLAAQEDGSGNQIDLVTVRYAMDDLEFESVVPLVSQEGEGTFDGDYLLALSQLDMGFSAEPFRDFSADARYVVNGFDVTPAFQAALAGKNSGRVLAFGGFYAVEVTVPGKNETPSTFKFEPTSFYASELVERS